MDTRPKTITRRLQRRRHIHRRRPGRTLGWAVALCLVTLIGFVPAGWAFQLAPLAPDWAAPLQSELTSPALTMAPDLLTAAGMARHDRDRTTVAQAAPAGGAQPPAEGVFASADEAARQSSNPLGGAFFVLLNQIDNYFLDGDATDELRTVNTWAFQPVMPISLEKLLGPTWIWVNRPTLPFILHADVPDVGGGFRLGRHRRRARYPRPALRRFPPGGLAV